MKFSKFKTNVGLKVVGATLVAVTTYGGILPMVTQPARAQSPVINASAPGKFQIVNVENDGNNLVVIGYTEDDGKQQVELQRNDGWLTGELVRNRREQSMASEAEASPVTSESTEATALTGGEPQANEIQAETKPIDGYTGIGTRLDVRDGQPAFATVFEGYPAHQAGLRADDILLRVNGQEVVHMPHYQIGELIRGEAGTEVVLTVHRTNENLDIAIVRDEVIYFFDA